MNYIQEMNVLEGELFHVNLRSMFGSTVFGWVLSKLPEGVILVGTDTISQGGKISPVIQNFQLAAIAAPVTSGTRIEFALTNFSNFSDVRDTCYVDLIIAPRNNSAFVSYSENAPAQDTRMKYGYPCGAADAQNAALKYGYPCGAADAQNAVVKYGYTCGAQDAAADTENVAIPYGYPYMTNNPYQNTPANEAQGFIVDGPFINRKKRVPVAEMYGFPQCNLPIAVAYGYPLCQ